MEFPFECDRATNLRVWPVWWRHGERKSAKRFPCPLPEQAGPDVIGSFEDRVFFTAPATGRVVVFDPASERVVDVIELGGYLADLIVEKNLEKVFVADALNNQVIALDPRHPQEGIQRVRVPRGSWSIALSRGQLYVACRGAKALAVIGGGKNCRLLKTVPLEASPVHIANISPEQRTLAVWPEPKTFDMLTLDEVLIDKELYRPVPRRTSVSPSKGTIVDAPKPHSLRVRGGGKTTSIDVKAVTEQRADVMDYFENLVFFTCPTAGRVGVVDVKQAKLVKTIETGGRLADLVVHRPRRKVYVADEAGNRIVVLDAKAQTIVRELKVPAGPCSLALVHDVAVQRTNVRPYQVQKLFVACREGKAMVVIDVTKDEVVKTIALPAPPVQVKPVPLPNTGWWPLLTPEQILFELRPRVAVRMEPMALHAGTLEQLKSVSVPERFGKRTSVQVAAVAHEAKSDLPDPLSKPHYAAPRLSPKLDGDLGEWAKTAPVELPLFGKGVSPDTYADWQGPKDLSGRFYVTWDDRALYFAASVTDEKYCQLHADANIWQGDCIQIAFDLMRNGSYDREYGLALSGDSPFTWCWYGPSTDAAKIRLAVKKRKTGLDYEAAMPWEILKPLTPGKGRSFGFTAAIMDSDGGDREGCVQWTPGIVNGKDALALGTVVLLDKQSQDALVTALRTQPARPAVQTTTVATTNNLMLRVGKKHVDVSAAVDPQLQPSARSLAPADQPGTITFAMDDGPEHDWTREVWMTPDQNLLLVNGTDQFWRRNAPTFVVDKGRHVLRLRANGPFAQIDGVAVARSLGNRLALHVEPSPSNNFGVFYDTEPVRFLVEVRNRQPQAQTLSMHYTVHNYMDETVIERKGTIALPGRTDWRPAPTWGEALELDLKDTGRHRLDLRLASADGDIAKTVHFMQLPKLDRPRLLFRKDDIPQIQARMQQWPHLFRRYKAWLRRRVLTVGEYYPGRFLPPGLTRQALGKAAPADLKEKRQREQRYGWRMFDLGWRLVACQFAGAFMDSTDNQILKTKLTPYLDMIGKGQVGTFCTYHHHGPFFPGAVASLYDMAAAESSEMRAKGGAFFARHRGNMNLFPWPLTPLEEPLTHDDRARLSEIMMWTVNLERYFNEHRGERGGVWWLNPWTYCQCPMQGIFLTFLYCRNVFGEPRTFDKEWLRGFLTFHRYVDPRHNKAGLLPKTRGPSGEPFQWMLSSLTNHPLEKRNYRWDEWVRQLNGKLPEPEEAAVDKLFDLGGRPVAGALGGGADHFVTGTTVPLALALGWYKPGAPEVDWAELPPTTLFDREGWACMRSGWDADATELSFISGTRDHTCRHHPTHFTVLKAGQFLINTSSLWGDDGNSQPCWANVVTVGDNWLGRWRINLQQSHPRQKEHCIINRFSPATWRYLARDRALWGYAPAEGGFGGGLDFHGHTESLFIQEGGLVAYETWPEFDYVAGDATNAWPVEQVEEMYRQLVYVKPDVIVVYDRVRLARPERTRWVACTAPDVKTQGSAFTVKRGDAALHGQVLLPPKPAISTPPPYADFLWRNQKPLEIRAPETSRSVEYLVVMNVGNAGAKPLAAELTSQTDELRVVLPLGLQGVAIRFRRRGPVGGHITITGGPRSIDHELVQRVDDSYRHWDMDPRFRKWMSEERFEFVVPERDRKAFSDAK